MPRVVATGMAKSLVANSVFPLITLARRKYERLILTAINQGTDDVVYSFKNAEEGIKLFTQSVEAKLVRVEGGVHFLGWIYPQVVAQELLNFVNPRSRGGSASP